MAGASPPFPTCACAIGSRQAKESFVNSTSNATGTPQPSDEEQLDKAAACMVSNSRQSLCTEPHEELFCRIFCCANAHPFQRNGKQFRQLCANALLRHYREVSKDANSNGRGKVGNIFFANSQTYTLDDPAGKKIRAENGLPCRDWTPDICVYDQNHKLSLIYDMKFGKDRWHEGQLEAYRKLVDDDKNKVMELNETSCKCAERPTEDTARKKPSTKEEAEKELQKMIENISAEFNT